MNHLDNSRTDHAPGITLRELIAQLGESCILRGGNPETRVIDVQQDSRRVGAGALFAARPGGKVSGTAFVRAAIDAGAVAVFVEPGAELDPQLANLSVPVATLPDLRARLSEVAEAIYGWPSRQIPIVGITGTNGKTTTALLVEHALRAAGKKPGRMGTVGFSFGGVETDSNLTTPEPDDITRFLAQVVANHGTHVVMEASSHSLSQGRVSGIKFDVAAFTNLTQDHLDYHGSMEDYEAAKHSLFTHYSPRASVINVDNATGERFAATARSSNVCRVGRREDCDVRPVHISRDLRGLSGGLMVMGRHYELKTRLVGEHNLENILVATGILASLDVDLTAAIGGWHEVAVPGRLERCDSEQDDILVLVDYAHTPDALERVLAAMRPLTQGRLHCVFGCGGDRDPGKRPKMGAAVGKAADRIIVTNDNPRTEDPRKIADAVEAGLMSVGARYDVELDRASAIQKAVLSAARGDVVLIAGKGHEPYQIVGAVKHAFDDRVEARRALQERRNGRAS